MKATPVKKNGRSPLPPTRPRKAKPLKIKTSVAALTVAAGIALTVIFGLRYHPSLDDFHSSVDKDVPVVSVPSKLEWNAPSKLLNPRELTRTKEETKATEGQQQSPVDPDESSIPTEKSPEESKEAIEEPEEPSKEKDASPETEKEGEEDNAATKIRTKSQQSTEEIAEQANEEENYPEIENGEGDEEEDTETTEQISESQSAPENAELASEEGNSDADSKEASKPSLQQSPLKETREGKFAYAFLLGGIPTPGKELKPAIRVNSPPAPTAYRGLLYNILVSVQILKDSGSKADFVLLVHMAEPNVELSPEDVRLIEEMGIILKYCPPYVNTVNEVVAVPLEKLRILDLIEYDRVLYMDADITPRCNLDYVMEQSYNGVLEKNVLVSIGKTPASAKFFVLTPAPGAFIKLISLIPPKASSAGSRSGFQVAHGWGHSPYYWTAITGHQGEQFTFDGANNDQGLLFQWAKYSSQSASIIRGDEIENWSPPPSRSKRDNETRTVLGRRFETWRISPRQPRYLINNPLFNNTLGSFSCLAPEDEVRLNMTRSNYPPEYLSPMGVAPYRDFIQWEFAESSYPWNWKMAPLQDATGTVNGDEALYRDWFRVLRQLDEKLRLGLGLHDKTSAGELPDDGNWKYVSQPARVPMNPMWSEGAKALRQWANRIVDTWDIFMPFDHPLVPSKEAVAAESSPTLRTQCQCSQPSTTDLCSSPTESYESWLNRRVPYYLSKQRPLCPNSARHQMHIILPFDDASSLENMQSSVCSAVCQDYALEKVNIYVFDNGSSESKINDLCKENEALVFDPVKPVPNPGKKGGVANEPEMQKQAKSTFQSYLTKHKKPSESGPSLVCIRFNEQMPRSGVNFWSFRMVESHAGSNDVVVLLENSEFSAVKALTDINEKYLQVGALMTYGSYNDNTVDPSSPIPPKALKKKLQPRKNEPSWVFGGPYSFKASLLSHFSVDDLAHKDASWLVDTANRGYVYRMLELSGIDRVGFMSDPIAKHKEGYSQPVPASGGLHQWHEKNVLSKERSNRWGFPLRLVMPCTKSSDLLSKQLGWIQAQNFAKRKTLTLHLLTNGSPEYNWVETTVNEFRGTKTPKGLRPIQVFIETVEPPLNSFSRFRFVRELRQYTPLEFVIFLDSDVYIGIDAVSQLFKSHAPRSMTSWNGKTFSLLKKKLGRNEVDFSSSSFGLPELVAGDKTSQTRFVYSGHDFAILDTNLWLSEEQLFRIQDDPDLKSYLDADDVWVSYVMDALLGWPMERLFTPTPPVVSIYRCSMQDYFEAMHSYLPSEVSSQFDPKSEPDAAIVAADGARRKLFVALQLKFHWNVVRDPYSSMRKIRHADRASDSQVANSPPPTGRDGSTQNAEKTKRAFVCVTGQFERFELKNKIKVLFEPMQGAGFQLDVALVVSNGTAVFTNTGTKKSKTAPFYTRFEDAVKDLTDKEINVVSLDGAYRKVQDPPIGKSYVDLLFGSQKYLVMGGKGGKIREKDEQMVRAQNHARIFESYRRCLHYADREAKRANSTLEYYYSAFVRIRDDIAFQETLDMNALEAAFPPPPRSIVVTECRHWHGMNDRLAIVAPDIAREYFERPLDMISKGEIYDSGAVRSPESLLLYTYLLRDIHVLGHPELKGLVRSYQTESGRVKYQAEDLSRPRCPKPQPHQHHIYDLYGWTI